jgi:GGDEF domain-containing protein
MTTAISANRQPAFSQRAAALGLTPEQTRQLWAVGAGPDHDDFAPVEQRTGALYSAARMAQSGTPALYVQVAVAGLGGLNASLGHSRADGVLAQARAGFRERLARAGTLTPLREQAGGFGFIVTGCQAGPDGLLQQATSAAREIGTKLQLSLTAAVLTADEAAATAVTASLKTSDSQNAARDPIRPDRQRPRFTSSGADRREAFLSLARRYGVDPDSAVGLYGVLLESRPDGLTGFERASDRESTVLKAVDYVTRTGGAALYVEVDVRNMGGLNEALGRQKADAVFAQIAGIVERELMGGSLSSLGDVWPFRHGGDEFSFVIVGRRPGIGEAQLEFATVASLTRATAQVKEQTKQYAAVPHRKDKEKRPFGTGIVWATSIIRPGMEPEKIFKVADVKVEKKKSAASAA